MAAPSETVWGSTVGSYGRIGLYVTKSSTNTETTVTVQVWFWSKYSVNDKVGGTLYLDNLSSTGSATTSKGAATIKTTVETGSGWSTSNQVLVTSKSYTYKHTRGTSAATRYIYAKLTNIDRVGGTMYATTTVSIPALDQFTIKYDANGGGTAPSNQSTYYGKSVTLPSMSRTGYSFQGWAKTASGSVAYKAGTSYTPNANVTLFAVWSPNTYTVTYNSNTADTVTNMPSNQTQTHDVTLPLSSTVPKRTNYKFLGWSTSKTATTATYNPGQNYTGNSALNLYAVWQLAYVKPRIEKVSITRCDSNGTDSDTGTCVRVRFDYKCDQAVDSINIEWETPAGDWSETDVDISSAEVYGSVDALISWYTFSTDSTYTFTITVTDTAGYNVAFATVSGMDFAIDFLAGGNGAAFNKPAELKGVLDMNLQAHFRKGILPVVLEPETDLNDIRTPGFYVGENVSSSNYTNCPISSGTFTLEVLSGGGDGQTLQRLTRCHKTEPIVYERWYHADDSIKDWATDSNGNYIWFGGWVYPSLESEFAVYSSVGDSVPGCRKDGQIVEIRGIVTPVSDIAGGTNTHIIFTVPEGYRPDSPVYAVCQGSNNCTWLLRVNTSGAVDFSRYRNGDTSTTAVAGTWLPFQITYFAK